MQSESWDLYLYLSQSLVKKKPQKNLPGLFACQLLINGRYSIIKRIIMILKSGHILLHPYSYIPICHIHIHPYTLYHFITCFLDFCLVHLWRASSSFSFFLLSIEPSSLIPSSSDNNILSQPLASHSDAQGTLWRHEDVMYCRRPEFPSHLTPNVTVLFPNLTIIVVPKVNQCNVDLVHKDKTRRAHHPKGTLKGRLSTLTISSTLATDTKGQNIIMFPPGLRTCPPFQFWLFFGLS